MKIYFVLFGSSSERYNYMITEQKNAVTTCSRENRKVNNKYFRQNGQPFLPIVEAHSDI